MGDALAACAAAAGTTPDIVWADERFLLDRKVEPWMGLPLWIPEDDPEGLAVFDNRRAIAAGLSFRPTDETAADTLAWELERPPGPLGEYTAGIPREQERELLAAWRAQDEGDGHDGRHGGSRTARVAHGAGAAAASRTTTRGRRSCSSGERRSLLGGVPMPWMTEWAGPFPVFVAEAEGARFTDVDGHTYVDFCLGDTGAMTGHAPKASTAAIAEQAAKGITLMLPTEDSIWVGQEMARRFGLPYWQFCLTATDANRFTIRLARAHHRAAEDPRRSTGATTGRSTRRSRRSTTTGHQQTRPGNVGPPVDPALTTRVVEFNDLDGLEKALAHEDVACVLAEPALTNIGIVLPGARASTRRCARSPGSTARYLVIDETHCICAGPGGATRAWGLEPDFLTVGKPLASGVPAACYGMSEEAASRIGPYMDSLPTTDVGGVGGTLSGKRAVARRDARDARARADRRGVRAHDRARRTVDGRRQGRHRGARPALGGRSGSDAARSTGSARSRRGPAARPPRPTTTSWRGSCTCTR